MDIVLTRDEKFTASVRKSNQQMYTEYSKFLNGLDKGEWAVSVHFLKWFAEGNNKGSDYEQYLQKICADLRKSINRKFYGKYGKERIFFVPVIEGMGQYKTTHLHLILGNLGLNNKKRVTKKLAEVFASQRMIDVQLNRLTKKGQGSKNPKRRIRTEALKTGEVINPVDVHGSRNAGMMVRRIVDEGWAEYVCKELKLKAKSSVVLEEIQLSKS